MVSSNARFFGTAPKKAARRCNGKILVYYIPIGKAVLETFACAPRCIHRKSSRSLVVGKDRGKRPERQKAAGNRRP
jgi:hypothetical protein